MISCCEKFACVRSPSPRVRKRSPDSRCKFKGGRNASARIRTTVYANGSKKHVEGGNLQGSISTTILTRDVTSVEWELRRCDDDGTIASSMKNYLEEKGRNCKVTVNESGERKKNKWEIIGIIYHRWYLSIFGLLYYINVSWDLLTRLERERK